jgi:hypothetical protein
MWIHERSHFKSQIKFTHATSARFFLLKIGSKMTSKMFFNIARIGIFDNVKKTKRAHDTVDLTYITPRVMAMSFPATGYESGVFECQCAVILLCMHVECVRLFIRIDAIGAAYRNDIEDVAQLLRDNHAEHFAVWNLTERPYDYAKLDRMVHETGWPDHHAPPLLLLFQIVLSIEAWLEADARNVVCIHCAYAKLVCSQGGTSICATTCAAHCPGCEFTFLLQVSLAKDALAWWWRAFCFNYARRHRCETHCECSLKGGR